MRAFIVLKPLTLGYDSDVRCLTPARVKIHAPGTRLVFNQETTSGNVWFFDADGERGKIECGELANLTRTGRIVEKL